MCFKGGMVVWRWWGGEEGQLTCPRAKLVLEVWLRNRRSLEAGKGRSVRVLGKEVDNILRGVLGPVSTRTVVS